MEEINYQEEYEKLKLINEQLTSELQKEIKRKSNAGRKTGVILRDLEIDYKIMAYKQAHITKKIKEISIDLAINYSKVQRCIKYYSENPTALQSLLERVEEQEQQE
jgi:hypothetical protein